MKNNETGEFELVVGNRQLLSGFFIVVLLFAVAFAMGYVLGQNSPRSARIAAETPGTGGMASSSNARPQPASPAPAPVNPPVPTADAAAGQQPPPDAPPQPTTKAVDDPSNTAPPANAAPQTVPASGIISADDLPAGSYWQAIAVKPSVAEAIRQTLRDKGFQVSLTPATATLTRVLVGPYGDTTALGRAKTDLESAGFQPVRYKRD
jgi:cell division protein FtsN